MSTARTEALRTILDAHGGPDHWRSLRRIDLEMSADGFLFTAKGVPPQRHVHLTISTQSPEAVLHDYPSPGLRAVLAGADRVEIRDAAGDVVEVRDHPRACFSAMPWTPWDAMNFAYFCGYAMWNYLNLPFLLLEPSVDVDVVNGTAGAIVLDVRFPPGIPTHSPVQRLYFEPNGRLYRHDYTAEVVGGWARAVHLCTNYRRFGGLWLPATRRVYPRGPFGRALPGPTLVAVDIHDVRSV
ncbi:MAG: hypothetical protein KDB50_15895 [Mycobacterium sp.]|nr:hypothetical protein [Mycobacterium sp.]